MKKSSSLSKRPQEDRGHLVVRFIEEAVRPLAGLHVLDLGCGQGEIAAALSASRARLTATDLSLSALKRARQRLQSAPEPPLLCANSALDLPFPTSQFDLVLLNGVLEWVGKAAPDKDPEACQLQALKEVYRILHQGGWLYLAIENRYYPNWILQDPHVKLPLLAVLPRRLANVGHRWLAGHPYVTYIHSYRKLRSLIQKAGFTEIQVHIPLFHYRWPLKVVPAEDGRRLAREVGALRQQLRNQNGSFSWLEELKFTLYRSTALLGLGRVLFPSFVVLARRA
jgi:ubiquinone/menaquinone biosynthesis C-methylase UbiE